MVISMGISPSKMMISSGFSYLLKAKGAWSFWWLRDKKPVIVDGDLMWDITCFFFVWIASILNIGYLKNGIFHGMIHREFSPSFFAGEWMGFDEIPMGFDDDDDDDDDDDGDIYIYTHYIFVWLGFIINIIWSMGVCLHILVQFWDVGVSENGV